MANRVLIMREAIGRIVEMLAEKNVKVTQRGMKAYVLYDTNGKPTRVNVPYLPEDAPEELLDAIQGFVDHEVAHILFTDFAVLKAAEKAGVANLHNLLEDIYVERRMSSHFTGSGINLTNAGAFFLKEVVMPDLEKCADNPEAPLFMPAMRAWAGQTAFVDFMRDRWHLLDRITEALGETTHASLACHSSKDCLDLAIKMHKLLKKAKPPAPPAPPPEEEGDAGDAPGESPAGSSKPEKSDEAPDDLGDVPDVDIDVGDYTADGDIESDPPPRKPDTGEPEKGEDEGGEGKDKPDSTGESESESAPGDDSTPESGESESGTSSSESGGETSPETEAGEGGDADSAPGEDGEGAKSAGADVPDDAPVESGEGEVSAGVAGGDGAESLTVEDDDDSDGDIDGDIDVDSIMKTLGKDFSEAVSDALSKAVRECAKGSDYVIYSTEFDVIEPLEVRPNTTSDMQLTSMTNAVDHLVGPLQKDLERAIAARSKATWSAGHRSGRLHASALARLTQFDDDRAFRRKHVSTSKDVAVTLLIDCSASMKKNQRIKTAAYSAYGLSAVLERMSISHEVIGFTTRGHFPAEADGESARLRVSFARDEPLYHPIMKGFGERLTSVTKRRFAALPDADWLCQNVDGESLQIAAARLYQRRESRKILMVLSDGQPCCPGDILALQKHLRDSVEAVEKSGVEVLAIGIQTRDCAAFYKKSVTINDVSSLPTTVMAEVKRLLMK